MVLRDRSVNRIRRKNIESLVCSSAGDLHFLFLLLILEQKESLLNRQSPEWWQIKCISEFFTLENALVPYSHYHFTLLGANIWNWSSKCLQNWAPTINTHTRTHSLSFFRTDLKTAVFDTHLFISLKKILFLFTFFFIYHKHTQTHV